MIPFAAEGNGEPGGAGAKRHFGESPHSASMMPRTGRLLLQLSRQMYSPSNPQRG